MPLHQFYIWQMMLYFTLCYPSYAHKPTHSHTRSHIRNAEALQLVILYFLLSKWDE